MRALLLFAGVALAGFAASAVARGRSTLDASSGVTLDIVDAVDPWPSIDTFEARAPIVDPFVDIAPPEAFAGFVQSIETGGADLLQRVETGVDVVTAAARKTFKLPARAEQYREPIVRAEEKYGLPEGMLARMIQTESEFNANAIGPVTRSGARAVGIAQFMPATALELGVDPLDPIASIDAAGRYVRRLYDMTGDWRAAVGAYNWGIGKVQREGLAAAPPETIKYLAKVFPA